MSKISSPEKENGKRKKYKRSAEKDLIETLQMESALAQQNMMRKLKLEMNQLPPGSAQLAEHQIVDPGSSNGMLTSNQSQRTCKISPLKSKPRGLTKGPLIQSKLTLKTGTLVTEPCESATESRSLSKTGVPTLSAQEGTPASTSCSDMRFPSWSAHIKT